jgi:hypothetical protein
MYIVDFDNHEFVRKVGLKWWVRLPALAVRRRNRNVPRRDALMPACILGSSMHLYATVCGAAAGPDHVVAAAITAGLDIHCNIICNRIMSRQIAC